MCFSFSLLTFTMKVRVPFSFCGITMLCTVKTNRASLDTPEKNERFVNSCKHTVNTMTQGENRNLYTEYLYCLNLSIKGVHLAGYDSPGGSWKGTVRPSCGPDPSGLCSLEFRESRTLNSMDFRKLSHLFSNIMDTTT